jgi:hypothetical protein
MKGNDMIDRTDLMDAGSLALADAAGVVVLANAQEEGDVLVLDNELALDNEGWALLAPFGEHWKARTVEKDGQMVRETFVQVFDEESVDAVVANEAGSGLLGRIKRALIKRPIYNGHPDLKMYSPETVTMGNESLIPLGVNDGCRKTARGLEFKPLLVPEGAKAVEGGCKFPSGLFLLKRTGNVRGDGAIEVRPFALASIGLTAHPNISGVDSLANANANTPAARKETALCGESALPKTERKEEMKSLLIGWLAAQGIALANESTEQAVFDAFLKEMGTRTATSTALGNEKTTLTTNVQSLTAARDAEKKRADDAVTALANEQTALKAERKARCEACVDLAIAQGRMDVAGRDGKVTELVSLANDKLAPALEEMSKAPVKFKVAAATADRGGKAGAAVSRKASEQILSLANEDDRYKGKPFTPELYSRILADNPTLKEQLAEEGAQPHGATNK